VTHDGPTYTMRDAICEPRPVQARLPILIGGSGPTKTLRTTARYADLWNGYGAPDRIAATSEILRERCAEIGRPFEAIERTVTIHAVIRDTRDAAQAAWDEVSERHGLAGRLGSDGSDRGLSVGGPPGEVAAFVDAYRTIGVSEVIVVFRTPFDHETIERIGEVRTLLAGAV
jgi:alkanesulfonate monooxygenase SsuD/methylene tetrahydromethanopterin reductase-like flavin-dependent oxidoreductase (luciferase family)